MPRTRKLLFKGIISLLVAIAAMALIWWEQRSHVNGNRSVPWSDWILLVYGFAVTTAGIVIFQPSSSKAVNNGLIVNSSSPELNNAELDNEHLHKQLKMLTDSKTRLEEQLHSQAHRFLPYLIQPLFLGGLAPEETVNQLKGFGYNIDTYKWYTVISLQIEPLEQTRFKEKDRELLYFCIQNMLEELIPMAYRLTPIRLENTVVLLVMSDSPAKETLRTAMEGWIATVQTAVFHYIRLKTCIGISRMFEHIEDCPSAFRESVKAFKYHQWSEREQSVLYFETMPSGQGIPFPEAHPLETEWFQAVKAGEALRAGVLLKQMIRDMFQKAPHPLELEMSMVRLLLEFLDYMRQSGLSGDTGQPMKTSLLQEVLELRNADEAEQWFKSTLMEPCLQMVEKTMKSYKRNLLDQIIVMIHEEYDTDISLELVASRLHYNSNYLSGVFNKEMNITFSEYLAKYRHEMALKWLIETELPIKDIAQRLQYKNSQNFIRSFRKSQDMTPGEYRLNYGRKPVIHEQVYMLEGVKEQVQQS